jgi:capsular exopolysaccharide synthesis family protein
MSLRDSVQVLRRRLLIVLVLVILGAAAGWVSAPGKAAGQVTYRATHTVIYQPRGNQTYNIEQVALLATSGDVPSRVAARLKLDRATVRSAVSAVASTDVSTIAITGRSADPALAVSLADVTADELSAEIAGPDQAAYDAQINQLTGAVDAARAHLNALPARDTAGQASARAELDTAQQALQHYQSSTPAPATQLVTLENASPAAVKPAGVKAPNSKTGRALLLGIFGLLVGLGGALALERFDSRIRSKSRAEEAFGAPVVAEVPPIAKALQGRLLTRTDATSPFIEAYRGLRTYVALWAPEADEDDGHRVILVTSPGAGEGKTTTVAHLAAMLAELGRSVVVISADLRRPRIHGYFDQAEGPGLVEALAASVVPEFGELARPTSVRNVRLVPSGRPVNNPAPLLEHAAELVRATRPLADFVLIDCPPLLVANDAVELARHADGVLMVARSGATPVEAAGRSAELLERLEIPVVGTVLVASDAVSNASRYYTSRYYAEPERSGLLRRRHSGGSGQAPADGTPVSSDQRGEG